MLIQLVGFMGSGKSTLGPLLALSLVLPFKDLDREVEARTGLKVETLFRDHGEEAFRRQELECYRQLVRHFHGVLALGGGLPCQPGMAEEIAAAGICLFLDVEPREVVRRLGHATDGRPLLAACSGEERAANIHRLMAERRSAYLVAGRPVVLPGELGIAEQLDLLLAAVKGWRA